MHLTKDQMSFFILRLAYSDTEDHRRWFLNQECALFSHRFQQEDTESRKQFILEHNLQFTSLSESRYFELKEELDTVARINLRKANISDEQLPRDYYEVDRIVR